VNTLRYDDWMDRASNCAVAVSYCGAALPVHIFQNDADRSKSERFSESTAKTIRCHFQNNGEYEPQQPQQPQQRKNKRIIRINYRHFITSDFRIV